MCAASVCNGRKGRAKRSSVLPIALLIVSSSDRHRRKTL
jgi:hypothetical protein